MIDDGYIVSTAVRLDEASRELRGIYETFGILPPDQAHRAFGFYTDLADGMPFYGASVNEEAEARADWIVRSFLPSLSEESLKWALAGGQLPVWTADGGGERARDRHVLFASSACNWHATLATGRYIPVQGQPSTPPSYVHARLWIKHDDWTVFRAHVVRTRGGVEGDALLNAFPHGTGATGFNPRFNAGDVGRLTEKAPRDEAQKVVKRGRPRGAQKKRSPEDMKAFEIMHRLIEAGEPVTTAAKGAECELRPLTVNRWDSWRKAYPKWAKELENNSGN